MRWMVVPTIKGTRGQHHRRNYVGYMLAILPVCCFFWLLSLWSPTCWLWQRDNDEEDGGGDDGTSRQHRRRTYVGYTTCVLFVFLLLLSLWSPTCCMAMEEGQQDGGDDDGTRGQHHRRKYVGYATCPLFFVVLLSLCCLLHAG